MIADVVIVVLYELDEKKKKKKSALPRCRVNDLVQTQTADVHDFPRDGLGDSILIR